MTMTLDSREKRGTFTGNLNWTNEENKSAFFCIWSFTRMLNQCMCETMQYLVACETMLNCFCYQSCVQRFHARIAMDLLCMCTTEAKLNRIRSRVLLASAGNNKQPSPAPEHGTHPTPTRTRKKNTHTTQFPASNLPGPARQLVLSERPEAGNNISIEWKALHSISYIP